MKRDVFLINEDTQENYIDIYQKTTSPAGCLRNDPNFLVKRCRFQQDKGVYLLLTH